MYVYIYIYISIYLSISACVCVCKVARLLLCKGCRWVTPKNTEPKTAQDSLVRCRMHNRDSGFRPSVSAQFAGAPKQARRPANRQPDWGGRILEQGSGALGFGV